jgi:hypothetical protein
MLIKPGAVVRSPQTAHKRLAAHREPAGKDGCTDDDHRQRIGKHQEESGNEPKISMNLIRNYWSAGKLLD